MTSLPPGETPPSYFKPDRQSPHHPPYLGSQGQGSFAPTAPHEVHRVSSEERSSWIDNTASPFSALDLAVLAATPARPTAFAIERIAPAAETTLLTGAGSSGKSLLGQQLATAAAASRSCLGLYIQPCPALYLTCEDGIDQLHLRQQQLCAAMGIDMASLQGRLHLVTLKGGVGNELVTFNSEGAMKVSATFRRLRETLIVTGAKLAILDNVAHLFAGNENIRGQVTAFLNLLNGLAAGTGAAILLLAHPNKDGARFSGSTAWENALRSRVNLDHDLDADVRTLSVDKANYSQNGEIVRFRWVEGAFMRDEDLAPDRRKKLAEMARANSENEAFLDCLRARSVQGPGREVGPSRGPNYAPAQFEGTKEARGYKRDALKRAMDRLYAEGRICSEVIPAKKSGRDKTIILEVPSRAPNSRTTQSHNPA